MPICRATSKHSARLAPTKALKTGAHATPHSVLQPPIRVDPVLEAEAVKLREAVARGAQEAQLARALESGGDAGQRGDPLPRAHQGWGRGCHGGGVGASALVVEESRVPRPERAGDEGAVAATTAHTASGNVEPVVELPLSSDKFGDSRDVDPAAAASTADQIAEFVSASEEVLSAGTSEGPVKGRPSSPGSPWSFSATSRRRKRPVRRSTRLALRFRTTSIAPFGFIG